MTAVSTQPSIRVGISNRVVWIKVEGKGSFQNSPGMKDFSKEMINRGYREFILDLKHCPVMDSTFMGTLAFIALRLRELGQGHLRVISLNERNHDLLCGLGLDQLFQVEQCAPKNDPETTGELQTVPTANGNRIEQAETMLEAHEALVEADPENLTKFKDVLEYLKQDLRGTE